MLQGNAAFRKGNYELAVEHYEHAHKVEPELPHYQLNLAAAYLKLNKSVSFISPPTQKLINGQLDRS